MPLMYHKNLYLNHGVLISCFMLYYKWVDEVGECQWYIKLFFLSGKMDLYQIEYMHL